MLTIPNQLDAVTAALVQSLNAIRRTAGFVGAKFHYGELGTTGGDYSAPTFTTDTVLSPDATTAATAITLANELTAVYNRHRVEATFVHAVTDATNTVTATAVTTRSGAITRANALYTAYNAHLTQSTVHPNNDTANAASDSSAAVTMSAITPAGSSPPTVTISGTPSDAVTALAIRITTGGPSGTAVFKWAPDGATYTENVATANTVALGTTGITVAFAHSGGDTYATDNVYTATPVITTLTTRLNDLKAALNAHVASAPAGHGINRVAP